MSILPGSPGELYHYRATITKVYDGDTVTADIDLGFGVVLENQKLRLIGINAPEVRGPERPDGLVARDWLREQILGKELLVRTYKDRKGKYGRWLAELWLGGVGINSELVRRKFAEIAFY